MKRGPRCPVCGSVNIKELSEKSQPDQAGIAEKEGVRGGENTDSGVKPRWKCGDCYRKFAEPEEPTK